MVQLNLPLLKNVQSTNQDNTLLLLRELLSSDLSFIGEKSTYSTHSIHAFPAKFPPQLPSVFIQQLTQKDDLVLDPMMGSGTTLLEANLRGRRAIGLDIDPLASMITKSKLQMIDPLEVEKIGIQIINSAKKSLSDPDLMVFEMQKRYDQKSLEFIDYWFEKQAQLELIALLLEIEKIENQDIRTFFEVVFSGIIITKNGGVSLARDLAHTRPHRDMEKPSKSPLVEFKKKLNQNLKSARFERGVSTFDVIRARTQQMPLADESIDLIVTSPPYAGNAIDYMRANKFSLVWFGYPIHDLGLMRRQYIGSEIQAIKSDISQLPDSVQRIILELNRLDSQKANILLHYCLDMKATLSEIYRVLKSGKVAIVVVATSIIRGMDVRTQECLAEIGRSSGLVVVGMAIRELDRDKRMMPARFGGKKQSAIENRMHQEFVIGFYKT